MTTRAAVAFESELHLLIDRFRDEWDLTYAEAVGSLTMAALRLGIEHAEEDEQDMEQEA